MRIITNITVVSLILSFAFTLGCGKKPDAPAPETMSFKQIIQSGSVDEVNKYLASHPEQLNLFDSEGRQPLHWAVIFCQPAIVKQLIEKGADPNVKEVKTKETPSLQRTPLHLASELENPECALALIEKGANIHELDTNGFTALHFSSRIGNILLCETLINKGAKINSKSRDGKTPLHLACANGQIEIVKLLLNNKAESLPDIDNREPILLAVINGHSEVVKMMASKGSKLGNPMLQLASAGGYADLVDFLLSQKLDPNSKDDQGYAPLHFTLNGSIAKMLLNKGAVVNTKNAEGKTPLHTASASGRVDVIEALLAKNADTNAVDNLGRTPLHLSANAKCSRLLILAKSNTSAHDINGFTPLHYAALNNDIPLVEMLIRNDSPIDATTTAPALGIPAGSSALDIAKLKHHTELEKLLLSSNHLVIINKSEGYRDRF